MTRVTKYIFFLMAVGLTGLFGLQLAKQTDDNTYQVTKVIDGDTIKVSKNNKEVDIRYLNIDTPEVESNDCFADEAKKINENLLKNKKVRLELDTNEMDRFGRTLAYVFATDDKGNEFFLNERLLQEGVGKFYLDTVNLKYQDRLIAAANTGHDAIKGLWKECAEDPAKGCIVKGNLDKWDHRWYHLPHFRHYKQIVIRLDQSDQWFCSEKKAIKAGFKKARE